MADFTMPPKSRTRIPATGHITRTTEANERAAILDVILAANPHLTERIEHFRNQGALWWEATSVVACADEKIVSTAVIFRRSLWTPNGFARFGGIGAVATQPEYRNRGLAAAVIGKCEEILQSEGIAAGILFCSIVPFYERLGWRVVQQP